MSKVTAVALLFDDVELGSHLRAALSEHSAQIAHEGPVSSFDVAKLRQAGVDVLVVNLDDSVDDSALDLVYELVASGDISVVFNDAQASRGLDGWDRARWARHLAAKALNRDIVDPPRPDDARPVETPESAVTEVAPSAALAATIPEPQPEPAVVHATEPEPLVEEPALAMAHVDDTEAVRPATSDTLAAELEALLALDEAQNHPEEEFGSLKFSAEDELPPLHDGDFSWQDDAASEAPEVPEARHEAIAEVPAPAPAKTDAPAFDINLDHLSLASFDEDVVPPVLEKATLAQQTPSPVAPEWGFVEEQAPAAPVATDKASFGVEKVSAADYLAPDVEILEHESPVEPGMSLELVSLEEAVAPKHDYEPYEAHLHELDSAFARLLVLGAARESSASLESFLAALPGNLKMPILLVQHHANDAHDQLLEGLATRCSLPVKLAAAGMRARSGEVVVVPRGQQVRITRDGRVELTAANDDVGAQSPSIDSSFTLAANAFGRDALAIVFAGQSTDAVAGAQAIHDRGGQVWVEASTGDHYSDMVNGVMAERLASFSGSPQELAVRLVEDFR